MLDKIILGILQIRPLTAYEIKKTLESTISHFYSTSYGSIHPALVKLETLKYISSKSFVENGRGKKQYTICKSGKTYFYEWLNEEISVSRVKEDSLVRLFFFGMIDQEDRNRIVTSYVQEIEERIKTLKKLKKIVMKKEVPGELEEVADFQIKTLEFGIDHSSFVKNWYQKLKKKMGANHE